MATVTPPFTRADFMSLPEGFPAQLLGGSLVKEAAPTYGNQFVASRIHQALLPLVGADRAFDCALDVVLDEQNVFHPDVLVLRHVPKDASDLGIPLLVFEILSPATARRDRGFKRRKYLEAGVEEVWIVDREGGTIEVHDRAESRTARGGEEIRSRALPGLALVPATLFAAPVA